MDRCKNDTLRYALSINCQILEKLLVANADILKWAMPWRPMERTFSSHCVNGEFPTPRLLATLLSRGKKCYWSWFLHLYHLYVGEEKILLPGQEAWATVGEQLMISQTTGAGSGHIVLIYLDNYWKWQTDIFYHNISAWHLVQTRMTDGLPMRDLVDGTVRVQTWDDSVHA